MVELSGQRPASTAEHGPCGGREQHRIVGRNLFRTQNKYATRLAEQRAGGSALQFGSELLAGFAGTLVQNHEVQFHAPAAGISTPLNKLANEDSSSAAFDPDQHDRQVTGDAMRPQPRLPQTVGGDGVRLVAVAHS